LAQQAHETGRRVRPFSYLVFLTLFAFALCVAHLPLLDLPFFWDEAGQFVPAALDIYRQGAWVPRSTLPNVHPPAVMAYLALVWRATGFSVPATRLAMLALGAAALLFAFLLAIRLCREAPGRPALWAAAMLAVSPLFFAQSMLAQLDMPAMLLTTVALLQFLDDRVPAAVAACTLLVLVKETGLIVPAVFAIWLWREGRRREAAWFLLPCVPLAVWLAVLMRDTGSPVGNQEFARYNLAFPLHPVRLAVALARRLHYTFVADFHWVGTAALVWAWRRTRVFAAREWRVAGVLAAAHLVLLSLTGGAALERYLLPVLPLLYAGFAAALACLPKRWRVAATAVLVAGLAAGNFINPPYAFPIENNLAFTDFVRLHQKAAEFLERNYPEVVVATSWPAHAEFSRPDLGYVRRKLRVRRLPDLRRATVEAVDWGGTDILVLYTSTWEPRWDLLRFGRELRQSAYGYEPDITPAEVRAKLPLELAARWERRGQWVEIYRGPGVR